MLIAIDKFSGIAPTVTPRRLAKGMAQTAKNVDLTSRTITGWKQPLTVVSGLAAADPSTIYRFGQSLTSDTQYWFHWTDDVDVVKGAISGDLTERTYYTHPSLGPMMTNNSLALTGGSGSYPWNSYKLGVPAPASTPVSAVQVVGDTSSPVESRYYVYTYVTVFGEEGPPSPVSNVSSVYTVGSTTRVTGLGATYPAGYANISAKRIYRTLSGNLATEFQLVDEIPVTQATYDDVIVNGALQEVIPSTTWSPPPAGAFGITSMANGITLLFSGYDVWPSEAFLPYAYPVGYSQSVDYPIVGGKGFGSSAVVLTTGHPYLLTGSDPSSMSLVKLDSPQACVSKRSIVAVDGGVVYASPDGLIAVSQTGQVVNVTDKFFNRATWQALVPASIRGYYHDGRYIGFYNNGYTTGGFIHDPSQADASFVMTDVYATAGFSDLLQDALYLKVGTDIVKWIAGASPMTATWRSGVFELPQPMNIPCAKVRATAYPQTFKMYANGALVHTETVANELPFWMPGDDTYYNVEVELINTTGEVTGVFLASSPEELESV